MGRGQVMVALGCWQGLRFGARVVDGCVLLPTASESRRPSAVPGRVRGSGLGDEKSR